MTMSSIEPDAPADVEAHAPAEPKTFAELGVLPATVEPLAAAGIITAFPSQELTLPMALAGTEFLKRADPAKGRFRALVFTALKHRLIDAGDRLRTLKPVHPHPMHVAVRSPFH